MKPQGRSDNGAGKRPFNVIRDTKLIRSGQRGGRFRLLSRLHYNKIRERNFFLSLIYYFVN
jgi:hypothetical protein